MRHSLPPESLAFLGIGLAAILAMLAGAPAPSPLFQTIALAISVGMIGLPHGALDPLIASRAGMLPDRKTLIAFHGAYLAAAGLMLAFWLAAPVPALAFFLLYSANHFAGDWLERPFLARTLLGVCVLSLPAALHAPQVAEIYAMLSGDGARRLAEAQHVLAPLAMLGVALAAVMLLRRGKAWLSAELVVLTATALLLPPLLFFIIYFCALHSPRHFLRLWRESPDKPRAARVALAYTAATIAIAIPAALVLDDGAGLIASAQRIVFIGLAALTVPHMILETILETRRHV